MGVATGNEEPSPTTGRGRPLGAVTMLTPGQNAVRLHRKEKDHPATRVLGTLSGSIRYPAVGFRRTLWFI
jgi:hypothetical protein